VPDISWPDLAAYDDTALDADTDKPVDARPALRAAFNATKTLVSARNQPGGFPGLTSGGVIDPQYYGGAKQPLDAILTALADLTLPTTDRVIALKLVDSVVTATMLTLGALGDDLLACADAASVKTLLALTPGTDVAAFNQKLDDLRAAIDAATTAGEGGLVRVTDAGAPTIDTATYITAGTLAGYALQSWVSAQLSALLADPDPYPQYATWDEIDADYLARDEIGASALALINATTVRAFRNALPRSQQFDMYQDFVCGATTVSPFAFTGFGATAGTNTAATPSAGHSGACCTLGSTASSGGGGRLGTNRDQVILQAESFFSSVLQPVSVADEIIYIGFHNGASATLPTDGAFFAMAAGGTVTPTLRASSTTSATGTTFSVTAGEWYRADVLILSGTQAWLSFVRLSDSVDLCGTGGMTLTGTVPTAAVGGQNLASSTYTNATARQLLVTDDLGVRV
jgi:hypothetical protein